MWVFVLLAIMIGSLIWIAYNQHVKDKNARDMHRMLKENKSFSVSDTSYQSRNTTSSADELERLAKMHKEGVLTDAEFEAAKKKVIHG